MITPRRSARRAALVGVAATAMVLSACGSGAARNAAAPPPDPGERGALVEATKLLTLSEQEIAAQLQQDGFPVHHVGNGAEIHRLTYRTIDELGRPTTATGVMALPSTSATTLSVVAFQHGTMPGRDEAPSVDTGGRSVEAMLFSSAGYAAVVPDYLGLGHGPGAHPYLHAATEVTAGIDLLRAARSAAAALDRSLEPKVLVTGFSQGGQAATALSKALAAGQGAPFRLRATAGVSGVYSLQHREIPALLEGRLDPVAGVFNLAYLLVAWNRIYHLYGDPATVFRAPYDTTIAALYDGSRSEDAIIPELPGSVRSCSPPRESICWHILTTRSPPHCATTTPPAPAGRRTRRFGCTHRTATKWSPRPTPSIVRNSSRAPVST